ncbi:MAG: hypothetical protein J6C93_02630 [Clostridia bacterium]|nr:hypothetical protein [Clostridia bacterium]
MKRQSKSFEIALSAVSCAVATLFLWLGTLNPFLLASGYIVGCFAMMIPLSKDFVWGNVLCYLASSLLACVLSGFAFFWKLLPFIVFFGLHPLVNHVQRKIAERKFPQSKLFPILCWIVKAVWFDLALYLCWKFTFDMNVAVEWINEYIIPVIFIGGTLFFLAYDRMIFLCQKSVNLAVRRIGR